MFKIVAPKGLSPKPDEPTKKGLEADYTGDKAAERVLLLNFWLFKYGTNDKTHAAAIVLSLLLLFLLVGVIAYGMVYPDHVEKWADKVFSWVGSAFLFVAGVAVGGKSPNDNGSGKKSDD